MIALVVGELAEVSTDSIIVMAGSSGIGYEIGVPQSVLAQLPKTGSTVKIHTYLQVREDAMQLYGFLTKKDLQFFKLMLGVSGIGPKGALGILSVMTPEALRFAIMSNDAKSIARAPGIGLKTAQKLVLELSDKVHLEDVLEDSGEAAFAAFGNSVSAVGQQGLSQIQSDAVLALTALGYSNTEALAAVRKVPEDQAKDENTLLKAALKYML